MSSASYTKKAKHTHMRQRESAAEDSPAFLVKHIVKSAGITVLAALGLLLVLSLGLYFSPNPNPLIAPMGIAAAGISALIGGMAAVKLHGHSALLCGLLNGSAVSAIMLLASLFFRSHASGYSPLIAALLHIAFFACSVAGAYLGGRTGKKKKAKRR